MKFIITELVKPKQIITKRALKQFNAQTNPWAWPKQFSKMLRKQVKRPFLQKKTKYRQFYVVATKQSANTKSKAS